MILGDPNTFAVLFDNFDNFDNFDGSDEECNEFVGFSVYGNIYPDHIIVRDINNCLKNIKYRLENIEKNDIFINMNTIEAYKKLYDMAFSSESDSKEKNKNMINLLDDNCYIFMFVENEKIRILSSRYKPEEIMDNQVEENLVIQDQIIEICELNEIIKGIDEFFSRKNVMLNGNKCF